VRVALYARVSTADKGQDPRFQTLELQEYCQRRGWSVAGEYVDVGISGTKEKRPELDRLMADAHRRRFEPSSVGSLTGLLAPCRICSERWKPSEV
jgi:DNA invertase Pin-like site-specific DNA recombinase